MNKNNSDQSDNEIISLLENVEKSYLKLKKELSFNKNNKEKIDSKLKSLYNIKVSSDFLVNEINDYKNLLLDVSNENEKEILTKLRKETESIEINKQLIMQPISMTKGKLLYEMSISARQKI